MEFCAQLRESSPSSASAASAASEKGETFELFPQFPPEIQTVVWEQAALGPFEVSEFMNFTKFDALSWPMLNVDNTVWVRNLSTDPFKKAKATQIGSWSGNDSASPLARMNFAHDDEHGKRRGKLFRNSERWKHMSALLVTCKESRLAVIKLWIEECNAMIRTAENPNEWTVDLLVKERDRLLASLGR